MGCPAAILAVALLQTTAVNTPRIETRGPEPVLSLPATMAGVLKAFDPDFKPRRMSDYPRWIWTTSDCEPQPECRKTIYKATARQALFAVVGDFNGDGILDVVVDGDNRTRGRRLAILSGGGTFSVSELQNDEHVSKQLEKRRQDGIAAGSRDDGLAYGLRLVRRGTVQSHYEPEPLVLKTDAFEEGFWETSAVVRYYRGGTWREYWTSD